MSSGSAVKPTLEQLEHLRKHHLLFQVQDNKVELDFVYSCGEKDCPVGKETLTILICPKPPCGRISGGA